MASRVFLPDSVRNFMGARPKFAELALSAVFSAGLMAAFAVVAKRGHEFSDWQWIIFWGLGIDLIGGAWTNSTLAARRWYHRSGARNAEIIEFNFIHFHPFVAAWAFKLDYLNFAAVLYVATMVATVATLAVPERYRRSLTAVAMPLAAAPMFMLGACPPMLAWFPLFYVAKLLMGHAMRETPPQETEP